MLWPSFFVVLSLSPAVLQSQTPSKKPDSATQRSRLDSIIRASLVDLPLASASVAILRGDDTLLWTAQGYADLENRVPASPSTVYRIGSITKQFTAAAILQQVERGAVRLDDDVAKYVPEYSSRGKRVTIRQLLNHTSGIKDISDLGDAFSRTLRVDVPQNDVLALIRDQPFNFEPGSNWSYNNHRILPAWRHSRAGNRYTLRRLHPRQRCRARWAGRDHLLRQSESHPAPCSRVRRSRPGFS